MHDKLECLMYMAGKIGYGPQNYGKLIAETTPEERERMIAEGRLELERRDKIRIAAARARRKIKKGEGQWRRSKKVES